MFGVLAKSCCGANLEVVVMLSSAGYYLGTADGAGPVTRESEYFRTSDEAQSALDNNTFTQRKNP